MVCWKDCITTSLNPHFYCIDCLSELLFVCQIEKKTTIISQYSWVSNCVRWKSAIKKDKRWRSSSRRLSYFVRKSNIKLWLRNNIWWCNSGWSNTDRWRHAYTKKLTSWLECWIRYLENESTLLIWRNKINLSRQFKRKYCNCIKNRI